MPVCKRCGVRFPNRYSIEGKTKNLGKRKFCLQCSPWGRHNTRNLCIAPANGRTLVCKQCGRAYEYDRRKGHTTTRCNSCSVNGRRFEKKQRAVDYLGGKCVVCGYARSVVALQFHHREATEKEFAISGSHARSWASILRELDKCVLLCANCHAELHAGLISI